MERRPSAERAPRKFEQFPSVLQQFVDGQLPLNEVMGQVRDVEVRSNPDTWVSSTRGTVISIGERKLPPGISRQFGWGAETAEEEYVVKVAHEYAHLVQGEYDAELLRWLDGADEVRESSHAYLQLYAALAELKGLHGLSQQPIYHAQNETTGNLDVPTYENVAETIGSYLLGIEYFLYRLEHARVPLTQEQAEALGALVVQVVENWKRDTL